MTIKDGFLMMKITKKANERDVERTSMVAGVVSSCLAPWFETQIPSTPCFTDASASSTVITPFTTIFIVVFFL